MKAVLIAAIVFRSMLLAVESASAQTWTQTIAPTNNWCSIASSADGNKLVAAANNGVIYSSSDSGNDWTSNNVPTNRWTGVASSADGSKLVAVTYLPSSPSVIYTSSDSGNTWTSNNVAAASGLNLYGWRGVASSADGKILIASAVVGGAVFPNFYAFISTNSGADWAPLRNDIAFIACSSDGTKLVADAYSSNSIITSTNSGVTWNVTNSPVANWRALASSADGSKLVAVVGGGHIYTSSDSGNSWTTNNVSVQNWFSVASSADGNKLVAAVQNGGIYASSDSGKSWTTNNAPAQNWYSVASSADGNKLFACVNGGGIWTLQTLPTPQLNVALSDTNLRFSWIVPSTNFVLQENSDLTTTDWVTLTDVPTLNLSNLNDEVVLSPSNSSGFYRLATP
jgi:hypothetical protein